MGMQSNNEHRITAEAFTAVIGNMAMGTSALLSSRTAVAEKRGEITGQYPDNSAALASHQEDRPRFPKPEVRG
jgi:hypothetical protein